MLERARFAAVVLAAGLLAGCQGGNAEDAGYSQEGGIATTQPVLLGQLPASGGSGETAGEIRIYGSPYPSRTIAPGVPLGSRPGAPSIADPAFYDPLAGSNVLIGDSPGPAQQ